MSFGPVFTLRTRGRQAKPETAREAFPAIAGWLERRAHARAERAAGMPQRRASDRRDPERGPR